MRLTRPPRSSKACAVDTPSWSSSTTWPSSAKSPSRSLLCISVVYWRKATSGPSRTTPKYAPPISGARAFTDAEPQRNRQLLWSQPHPEPAVTSGRRGRIHGDSRPQWYWQDHVVEDLDGAD